MRKGRLINDRALPFGDPLLMGGSANHMRGYWSCQEQEADDQNCDGGGFRVIKSDGSRKYCAPHAQRCTFGGTVHAREQIRHAHNRN